MTAQQVCVKMSKLKDVMVMEMAHVPRGKQLPKNKSRKGANLFKYELDKTGQNENNDFSKNENIASND